MNSHGSPNQPQSDEPSAKSSIRIKHTQKKNKNYHGESAKEPIKKRKILTHDDQSDSSGNNHRDRKSEIKTNLDLSQKHDSLKKGHKKLSFFHSDEDGSDESSSSPDQPRSTSNKRAIESQKKRANIYHTNNNNDVKTHGSNKPKESFKHAEGVPIDHDDASSTSSCSCEDHSSVAGRSEDFHEDLDYDEDSITNSPTRLSTNNPATANTNSNTPSSVTIADPATPINPEPPNSKDKASDTRVEKQTTDGDEKSISERGSQLVSNSRIRSVINFSHTQETAESKISNHEEKSAHDRSHKSYDCLLKYFFKDACFFQIKSINHENVELSKSLGVWSTPVPNEIRLNAAFKEHRNVILIFSVQQSGGFQGFARMVSKSKPTSRVIPWVLPERMSNRSLGGVFKVEWLCTKKLPFHDTNELVNPFNDNKPVKVARDGQQVEQKVGKKLCRLFPQDSKERLLAGIATLKRQTSLRKKSPQRYDSLYTVNDWRSNVGGRYRHTYVPMQSFTPMPESAQPANMSQKQFNYNPPNQTFRSNSRRQYLESPTRAMYSRYNQQYPVAYPGPIRPHQIPRNVISRWPIPDVRSNFYHNQPYLLYPNNQYANQQDNWGPNPSVSRYFPYQRPRR